MNIFFLHRDPRIAAEQHCDKHVVKMIVEYSQLLSTAHRVLDGVEYIDKTVNNRSIRRWRLSDDREQNLCLASHINHPSAVWARSNIDHYRWLHDLLYFLIYEYKYRYNGKRHKTEDRMPWLMNAPHNIPIVDWSDPPPAMKHYPQCIVQNDSIQSYRNYYLAAKADFAKWKVRGPPSWWIV